MERKGTHTDSRVTHKMRELHRHMQTRSTRVRQKRSLYYSIRRMGVQSQRGQRARLSLGERAKGMLYCGKRSVVSNGHAQG